MVRKEGKFSDAICRKVLASNSFASVGCWRWIDFV